MWKGYKAINGEIILNRFCSQSFTEVRTREEKNVMFLACALGIVIEVINHYAVLVWGEGDIEFEE